MCCVCACIYVGCMWRCRDSIEPSLQNLFSPLNEYDFELIVAGYGFLCEYVYVTVCAEIACVCGCAAVECVWTGVQKLGVLLCWLDSINWYTNSGVRLLWVCAGCVQRACVAAYSLCACGCDCVCVLHGCGLLMRACGMNSWGRVWFLRLHGRV